MLTLPTGHRHSGTNVLDSILRWYDSIKAGLDAKLQHSYTETLGKVLSRKEKILLYDNLRTIAAAYKIVGNYQELDRHLEAADLLRKKFKLKIPKNNQHRVNGKLENML